MKRTPYDVMSVKNLALLREEAAQKWRAQGRLIHRSGIALSIGAVGIALDFSAAVEKALSAPVQSMPQMRLRRGVKP